MSRLPINLWFSADDGRVTWKDRLLIDARSFVLAPPEAGKPFIDALLALDQAPGSESFGVSLDWCEHELSGEDFASREAWLRYMAMMENSSGGDFEISGAEVGAVHIEFGVDGARESFLAALATAEMLNGLNPD
jgi:hypothetical protein